MELKIEATGDAQLSSQYTTYIKGPQRDQSKAQELIHAKNWEEMIEKGFEASNGAGVEKMMVCMMAYLEDEETPHCLPYWQQCASTCPT